MIIDQLEAALAAGIAFLPRLLAALVILVIGLLIAKALQRLTETGLDRAALHRRESVRRNVTHDEWLTHLPSGAGRLVFWVVAIITIGVAVDTLDLAWLSAGVARVLEYLPNVLAAAVIVVAAYLLGNFVYRQLARPDSSNVGARAARAGIYVIAGFMAVHELGIATGIVVTAFTLLLGALAVAAAVAFGLGNRELAGRVTREWYDRRAARREPRIEPELRSTEIEPPIVQH